jgi:hypothetical protein
MTNTELLEYVKQQMAQGVSKETIYTNLTTSGGWHPSDVSEVFSTIGAPITAVPTPSGTMPNVPLKYAGFWVRWVAVVVDSLVLIIPTALIQIAVGLILAGYKPTPTTFSIVGALVSTVVSWAYFSWMTYNKGSTLGKMMVGITVKSDFFDLNADASAPSNAAYTAAAAYCQNLVVFQKSDIKRHDASDQARRPAFRMKLADLLNDLKTMFNLDWTITDAGATFRLEHVSYFAPGSGNDYTTAKYKKELEQDKADAKRLTRFSYRDEQCYAYFKGSPIEIYCGEDEKEVRLTLFSCDISFIVSDDGLESIGDDGFVLMTTTDIGGTLYNITNNRPLAWTELHENFHKWEMAGVGEINGAEVTPLSLKKTRKQPAFIVPHCCDDTFDPYELITTALGDGEVQTAGRNLAKNYLEIEPKY